MKIVGRISYYSPVVMNHMGFPFSICKSKVSGVCEMQNNKGIQIAEEEKVTEDLYYGSHKILLQHIFSHDFVNYFPSPEFAFCKKKMNLTCTVIAINIDF